MLKVKKKYIILRVVAYSIRTLTAPATTRPLTPIAICLLAPELEEPPLRKIDDMCFK